MYLKLLTDLLRVVAAAAHPHLQPPQPVRSEAQRQLVAPPLVLEAIDAAQGLGDGDVEDEVGHGEQTNGDPAVAALQPGRLRLAEENQGQEEEEELEHLP